MWPIHWSVCLHDPVAAMSAAIENAMLARLKAAADAGVLGYKWRTLETYPENWDEYFKEKTVQAPAAWVVFAGMKNAEEQDSGDVHARASFGLVIMAENARNETARRHGSPGTPGSYQLRDDAIGLIVGQSFGLPISRMQFIDCRSVRPVAAIEARKVSMYALEFQTTMIFQPQDFEDVLGIADFTSFHANWDVPGFGGIDADPASPGLQIPDDAHADATDHVELQQ